MAQSCGRCSEVGGIQAPEEAELGGGGGAQDPEGHSVLRGRLRPTAAFFFFLHLKKHLL